MVFGSRAGCAPAVLAIRLRDRHIIDRRQTTSHQPVGVELPVLVAVGAEPVTRVIVPLVGKAHGDAVLAEGPDLLDQSVVEFAVPLAAQKLLNGSAPAEELGPVAPL